MEEKEQGQGKRSGTEGKGQLLCHLLPSTEVDLVSVGSCRGNGSLGKLDWTGVGSLYALGTDVTLIVGWQMSRGEDIRLHANVHGQESQLLIMMIITRPISSSAALGSRFWAFKPSSSLALDMSVGWGQGLPGVSKQAVQAKPSEGWGWVRTAFLHTPWEASSTKPSICISPTLLGVSIFQPVKWRNWNYHRHGSSYWSVGGDGLEGQEKWDIRLAEMGQGESIEGLFPKQRWGLEVLTISESQGLWITFSYQLKCGYVSSDWLHSGHPGWRLFKYPKDLEKFPLFGSYPKVDLGGKTSIAFRG